MKVSDFIVIAILIGYFSIKSYSQIKDSIPEVIVKATKIKKTYLGIKKPNKRIGTWGATTKKSLNMKLATHITNDKIESRIISNIKIYIHGDYNIPFELELRESLLEEDIPNDSLKILYKTKVEKTPQNGWLSIDIFDENIHINKGIWIIVTWNSFDEREMGYLERTPGFTIGFSDICKSAVCYSKWKSTPPLALKKGKKASFVMGLEVID